MNVPLGPHGRLGVFISSGHNLLLPINKPPEPQRAGPAESSRADEIGGRADSPQNDSDERSNRDDTIAYQIVRAISAGAQFRRLADSKGKEAEVKSGTEFGVYLNQAIALPRFVETNNP